MGCHGIAIFISSTKVILLVAMTHLETFVEAHYRACFIFGPEVHVNRLVDMSPTIFNLYRQQKQIPHSYFVILQVVDATK